MISKRITANAFALACAATLACADDPTLDSLKQTYAAEVKKLKDEHAWNLRSRLQDYSDALDKVVEVLKQRGDPDLVLKARNEQQRFCFARTVPYPPSTNLPVDIVSLQVQHHRTVRDVEIAKGKAFSDLTRKYIAALDRLMKQLTVQDKLDIAMDVKAEKQATEGTLADLQAQLTRMAGESPTTNLKPTPAPAKTAELKPQPAKTPDVKPPAPRQVESLQELFRRVPNWSRLTPAEQNQYIVERHRAIRNSAKNSK